MFFRDKRKGITKKVRSGFERRRVSSRNYVNSCFTMVLMGILLPLIMLIGSIGELFNGRVLSALLYFIFSGFCIAFYVYFRRMYYTKGQE